MTKNTDGKLQGFIQTTKTLDSLQMKKDKLKEELKKLEQKKALLEKRSIARAENARRKLLQQKGEVVEQAQLLECSDEDLQGILEAGFAVFTADKQSNFTNVDVLRRLAIAEAVLTSGVDAEIDMHVLLGMMLLAKSSSLDKDKAENSRQVAIDFLQAEKE